MGPKVSVVMPVLNGKRFIGEAVASIVAQTYRNYELVLVDDGSTDGTYDEVKRLFPKLNLKYVRHAEPQGIPRSMNDGIRHASGDLIAFLDHDDSWFPDFLEVQAAYLQAHPEVAMVHSDFQTTDVDSNILEDSVARCRKRNRPSGYVFPQLFHDCFICGNTVLIHKECLERTGGFDERLRWGDYLMWMRLSRHYRIDYTPKVLTRYRQHPSQSTRSGLVRQAVQEPVGLQALKYILEEYPEIRKELGERTVRRRMALLYFEFAYIWFTNGELPNARSALAKAIRLSPVNARYHLLYAASLLRPSQAMALREGWHRLRRLASFG
jgi:glycosyltransferase involved in cell wall biosynthesis